MPIEVEFLIKNLRRSCDWKTLGFDYVDPAKSSLYDFLRPNQIGVVNSEDDEDFGNIDLGEMRNRMQSYVLEGGLWRRVYPLQTLVLESGMAVWLGKGNKAMEMRFENVPLLGHRQIPRSDGDTAMR